MPNTQHTGPIDQGVEHDEGIPVGPPWLDQQDAALAFIEAKKKAASMDRHPAGKDLEWNRIPLAQNFRAMWTMSGLRLAFWTESGVTTLRVDEQGQQALRTALGINR